MPPLHKALPPVFSSFSNTAAAEAGENLKIMPARGGVLLPNQEIWNAIAVFNGNTVALRRKPKDIDTGQAALILLGAAKVLRDIPDMTALELSKSLKLSGYLKDGKRLDRALINEIESANLLFQGNKRNRSYIITQKGIAKAFTSIERII
jgi:hypothetical protein